MKSTPLADHLPILGKHREGQPIEARVTMLEIAVASLKERLSRLEKDREPE